MNVVVYARVSTKEQDCNLQLGECFRYASARWPSILFFPVYQDVISGAKASRPKLDKLLEDARQRKIDCVLVWKLDRFGRSLRDCLNLIGELEALNVRFISVTQGLDTDASNPVSRFMLQVLGAAAEFERELIRDRVRAGVQARKAKGLPVGRQRKVFRRDLVLEMKAAGRSLSQIAKELGVSKATVGRVR